jgi:GDP-L-fucose synthase
MVYKVEKVISLLSTCIYPDIVSYPLTEEQIHNGPPHSSNFAYAHAKRMIDIQSRAYRKQYGCNFITAVPNNLFGEHDNFHLNDSHVIPAIIRKIYDFPNKKEKK